MGIFDNIFQKPKVESPTEVKMTASDVTINHLLDYIGSGGDNDVLSLYGVATFGNRNSSISFPTFFRAITLISSMIAQIMTTGSLRIVDRDGKIVKTARARRTLDLFQSSLGGEVASFNEVEDFVTDYLIDGNSLLLVSRSTTGALQRLQRLNSWDADVIRSPGGSVVYRSRLADDPSDANKQMFALPDVAHIRWPKLLRSTSASYPRRLFASSPAILMRVALDIGISGDHYIRDWYQQGGGAHRSNIGISVRERLTPDQTRQLNELFAAATAKRAPLVVGGGANFSNLTQNASNKDQADLRDFQVSEFGRVYGIPGPLLNQQVTQWGSGIEQLAKFFWRFGLRQHTERVLSAIALKTLPVGQRYAIDDTDLLRGDAVSISSLLAATGGDAQRGEVATREERRIWAGLPLEPEYGELKEPPEPVPQEANMGGPPGEKDEDQSKDE